MIKRATNIDAEIGARVRTLRLARDMTQEVLAEKLGVTYQQLQKYETGHNRISGSRFIDLAKHLKVPVAALFGQDTNGKRR